MSFPIAPALEISVGPAIATLLFVFMTPLASLVIAGP